MQVLIVTALSQAGNPHKANILYKTDAWDATLLAKQEWSLLLGNTEPKTEMLNTSVHRMM